MRTGHPFLRRDRRAVTPILAEMLMVATTVVMGVSAYLMYDSVANQAASVPSSFSFRSTATQHAQIPEYCCLNDTIVEVVTIIGNPVEWGVGLEYTISAAGSEALLMQGYLEPEPANLTDIYLGVYWGSPDEASICNIWYSDIDRNAFVTTADHLSLRGMSKEFHGAVLRIVAGDRIVGSQVLP